jgi:hypothetical protein
MAQICAFKPSDPINLLYKTVSMLKSLSHNLQDHMWLLKNR